MNKILIPSLIVSTALVGTVTINNLENNIEEELPTVIEEIIPELSANSEYPHCKGLECSKDKKCINTKGEIKVMDKDIRRCKS